MAHAIEQRFPQLSLYIAAHYEGDTDPIGFAPIEASFAAVRAPAAASREVSQPQPQTSQPQPCAASKPKRRPRFFRKNKQEEFLAESEECLAAPEPVPVVRMSTHAAPAPAAVPSEVQESTEMPAQPVATQELAAAAPIAAPAAAAFGADLSDMLSSLDASFSETVLALIDARGLRDAEVYKRANISRQLFSNIRGDASYRPTKKTALALAIALELTLDETNDLLSRAGYALSHSSKADVIVEYFITIHEYNLFTINEALFAYDQPLI